MNTIKRPHPNDLRELVEHAKACSIEPESRACDEEDTPGICLTVGWNHKTGKWDWQTGDNTYSGRAYGYPIWAFVDLHADTDAQTAASDILAQLEDQIDDEESN